MCKCAHLGASIVAKSSSKFTFTTETDVRGRRDLQLDRVGQPRSCHAPAFWYERARMVTLLVRYGHVISG